MQQFWLVGFEATTLQDLLRVMKLSKSSLYQTFGNKQVLFKRCIEHYTQGLSQDLTSKLEASPNGKVFIESIFSFITSEASCDEIKGCLLVNAANEMGQRDKGIANLVGKGTEKLAEILELAIISAQQDGVIDSSKNAKNLADYLVVSICGIRTMVKAGTDKESLLKTADVILSVLD